MLTKQLPDIGNCRVVSMTCLPTLRCTWSSLLLLAPSSVISTAEARISVWNISSFEASLFHFIPILPLSFNFSGVLCLLRAEVHVNMMAVIFRGECFGNAWMYEAWAHLSLEAAYYSCFLLPCCSFDLLLVIHSFSRISWEI